MAGSPAGFGQRWVGGGSSGAYKWVIRGKDGEGDFLGVAGSGGGYRTDGESGRPGGSSGPLKRYERGDALVSDWTGGDEGGGGRTRGSGGRYGREEGDNAAWGVFVKGGRRKHGGCGGRFERKH